MSRKLRLNTKKRLAAYRRRKAVEREAERAEELRIKKEAEAWAKKNDKVLTS